MAQDKFANVSNPAAFGAEWTDSEGSKFQLVNSRGTGTLVMGFWNADQGRWFNTSVSAPERFGMNGAPRNWREFAAIVRAFITAGSE